MAHDVFVSYSNKDKPVADAAAAALEARGIRCWIAPRDILPGVDWSEAIIDAIEGSRVMLVVFSQSANDSHQIKREVERAVAKGIAIIPLRIENVPLAKSLEYFISMPHWIDALTPERQSRLDYLAETVGMLLARQAGKPIDATPVSPTPLTPAPSTAKRGPPVAIIGLALAAIAIGAVVLWAIRPKPEPGPSPSPLPSPPRSEESSAPQPPATQAIVDPRLVGDWTATFTKAGVTTKQRMEVASDGDFTWDVIVADEGTMQAGNGGILQNSKEHGTFAQAYSFADGDTVTITGPAGAATWRRMSGGANVTPTLDGRLVGSWASESTDADANTWKLTFDVSPIGAYTFRSVLHQQGAMRTKGSRWTATSNESGQPHDGDMTFQGKDTVVLHDDTSGDTVTWRRRP